MCMKKFVHFKLFQRDTIGYNYCSMPNETSHDSETSAQGQQVITACAFIHNNFEGIEKLFLPKRAATKKFLPGVFELPGGHIDFGEDIVEGLKREVKEEFGMEISVGDSFYTFTYPNEIKGSHSIEAIYFARFTTPLDEIKIDPQDHSEYGWFTKDEITTKVVSENKKEDDIEIGAMLKGFSLLAGNKLNFG